MPQIKTTVKKETLDLIERLREANPEYRYMSVSELMNQMAQRKISIIIGKDGSVAFLSPDMEGSYSRFKKVIG